ncbi:hypothetical protein ABPG72_000381 [Tetrahymena utriculariae]
MEEEEKYILETISSPNENCEVTHCTTKDCAIVKEGNPSQQNHVQVNNQIDDNQVLLQTFQVTEIQNQYAHLDAEYFAQINPLRKYKYAKYSYKGLLTKQFR